MAQTASADSRPRRSYRLGPISLAATGSLALLLAAPPRAIAQVAPGGLGTRVNGTALGRCSAGVCTVEGGTAAGRTLFHRFSQYDTRSGIRRVDLDTRGRPHVVVGVGHPEGSFFGAPLRLNNSANLFWLSPGGLWFGAGGQIQGATSLLLSTAPTLRIGGGEFRAAGGLGEGLGNLGADPPLDLEVLARGGLDGSALGTGNGPIVLAGGRLSVDRHLLLHSGAGPIRSAPGDRMVLQAGRSVQIRGGQIQLRGLEVTTASSGGADDGVQIRSGPLVGGGLGPLELRDAELRASRVLLQGSGGLLARDLQAQATGGSGLVQISAGAAATGPALRLERVTLQGPDVLVGANGSLTATDLRAMAGTDGAGGRLELAASAATSGGPSLQLERADLLGATIVVRAEGAGQLRQLRAVAGGSEAAGGIWITTRPGGGEPAGPLQLDQVSLAGSSVVVQAAGWLRSEGLQAQADQLWLQSGSGSERGQGSLQLEGANLSATRQLSLESSGDLLGQEVQATAPSLRFRAGGELTLAESDLKAPGRQGQIQLDALSGQGPGQGRLAVHGTRLEGQAIVAQADQTIHLQGVTAVAGRAGDRGPIRLETSPGPHPGAAGGDRSGGGEVRIAATSLEGQRVLVRSGAIQVSDSRIAAPKGKIHLEAIHGDLALASSQLDVGAYSVADLRTPVNLLPVGGNEDSLRATPSIGLFAGGNLTVEAGSAILAGQANPGLPREQIRLTDTSGVIVVDAGSSLAVRDSRIEANATDNLAGNLLLRARGVDGSGGLTLRHSILRANDGAGSGDIRLNSASGIQIEGSELTTRSSNRPADPKHAGKADWSTLARGAFSGGEITLTNSSLINPITIVDSELRAEQSASGSLLSIGSLTGSEPAALLKDSFDSSDSLYPNYSGGIITLLSQGGITISGPHSVVSATSQSDATAPIENFGGIVRLLNTSNQPLQILDGARLEASTGNAQDPDSLPYTMAGAITLWNRGPIRLADSLLSTASAYPPADEANAPYYQGSLALESASEIRIARSQLAYGPEPGAFPGLGQLTLHSPTAATLSDTTLTPACENSCTQTLWDSRKFEEFLYPASEDSTPRSPGISAWGILWAVDDQSAGRGINPYIRPENDRVRDQAFEGGEQFSTPLPTTVRRWIDTTPVRTVFLPEVPPIRLGQPPGSENSTSQEGWPRGFATGAARPAAPLAPTWLAMAAPPQPRAEAGITLSLEATAASSASVSMGSDASQTISEAAAAATFERADQAASNSAIASLGLRQPNPASPGVAALQRMLQQSMQAAALSPGDRPVPSLYVPAILQISITALPNSPELQINHVLIPAAGEIRGWQTQLPGSQLQAAIHRFQQRLSQDQELDDDTDGKLLSDLLIAPVLPVLKRQGINTLLLALDRGLQGVPFAALPVAGGSLVDQVAITITPALALTDLSAGSTPAPGRRTLLAGASRFANGLMPLPMTEQELRRLAALHDNALVLLDGAFQTSTLLKKSREQPLEILHLATHAEFARQRADGARIYTSDGELSLADLGRQLRTGQPQPLSLFVLNACRTAVGNEQWELGIAGLALQAGASSAMGNLWLVDDAVAAAFAVEFHHALQRGISKDLALQQTQQRFRLGQIRVKEDQIINAEQQTLISGLNSADQARLRNSLHHPYFWAGMVLTGRPW